MKQEKIILELRASEGGSDSKLLVADLANIYLKSAKNNNFSFEIKENRPGFCLIWLNGKGVKEYFRNESGGHRFLRVPPTEKRGRTQTSIVTVAIMEVENYDEVEIPKDQIKIETTRGSGPGGQHKNSTDSCVIMTHIPTGIKVVRDGRSQISNREYAYNEIKKRVNEFYRTGFMDNESKSRKDQVGMIDRSIKKRSYRIKEDLVIDHETSKSCSFKEFNKGKIELVC